MRAVLVILGFVLMVIASLGLPSSIIVGIFDFADGVELVTALGSAAKAWLWLMGGGILGFCIFVSNA